MHDALLRRGVMVVRRGMDENEETLTDVAATVAATDAVPVQRIEIVGDRRQAHDAAFRTGLMAQKEPRISRRGPPASRTRCGYRRLHMLLRARRRIVNGRGDLSPIPGSFHHLLATPILPTIVMCTSRCRIRRVDCSVMPSA